MLSAATEKWKRKRKRFWIKRKYHKRTEYTQMRNLYFSINLESVSLYIFTCSLLSRQALNVKSAVQQAYTRSSMHDAGLFWRTSALFTVHLHDVRGGGGARWMKNGSCTSSKQLKKNIDVRQAYSRCFCVVHRAWPWRDVQQMEREYGALVTSLHRIRGHGSAPPRRCNLSGNISGLWLDW